MKLPLAVIAAASATLIALPGVTLAQTPAAKQPPKQAPAALNPGPAASPTSADPATAGDE